MTDAAPACFQRNFLQDILRLTAPSPTSHAAKPVHANEFRFAQLTLHRFKLYIVDGDAALVICEEELDGGTLVASNLFVREDAAWHIAHHQASQLVARRPQGWRPTRLN